MGITRSDVKTSRFIRKEDIGEKKLFTISGADKMNVAPAGQPVENKVCVRFKEIDKPFVLNYTNYNTIVDITGSEDSDGWIGKQLVMYFDPNISFSGKMTGGLRLRKPVLKNAVATKINQATQEPKKLAMSKVAVSDNTDIFVDDDTLPADIF
jgi:hypothetical protein